MYKIIFVNTQRRITQKNPEMPRGPKCSTGWGLVCWCEANANVPGAPRILDPPQALIKAKGIKDI